MEGDGGRHRRPVVIHHDFSIAVLLVPRLQLYLSQSYAWTTISSQSSHVAGRCCCAREQHFQRCRTVQQLQDCCSSFKPLGLTRAVPGDACRARQYSACVNNCSVHQYIQYSVQYSSYCPSTLRVAAPAVRIDFLSTAPSPLAHAHERVPVTLPLVTTALFSPHLVVSFGSSVNPLVLVRHERRHVHVCLCPGAGCSRRICPCSGSRRHPAPSATIPCPPPSVNHCHCPSARVCDAAPVGAATSVSPIVVRGACRAAVAGCVGDARNVLAPLPPGVCGDGPE